MFSIEWPPIAYKMIAVFQSTFNFEILQMPGSFPLHHTFSDLIDYQHDKTPRFHAQSPCDIMPYAPSH
jgi:hypothetical protein